MTDLSLIRIRRLDAARHLVARRHRLTESEVRNLNSATKAVAAAIDRMFLSHDELGCAIVAATLPTFPEFRGVPRRRLLEAALQLVPEAADRPIVPPRRLQLVRSSGAEGES